MTDDGDRGLDAQRFLNLISNIRSVSRAFGYDHHKVGIARQPGALDTVDHILLKILHMFRHQDGRSAYGSAHIQGEETRVAAHDLHHGASLMGLHGIAQFVDAFDGCIAGGVESNGIIGAANIVVDGAGDAHNGNAKAAQFQRAAKSSVTADGHDTIQP